MADTCLDAGKVIGIMRLEPEMGDADENFPRELWEKKIDYIEKLRCCSNVLLVTSPGADGSEARSNFLTFLRYARVKYGERKDANRPDTLGFLVVLNQYVQAVENNDPEMLVAEKKRSLAHFVRAFGRVKTALSQLNIERQSLDVCKFGSSDRMSQYRCGLSGLILEEPYRLMRDSKVFYSKAPLDDWMAKCETKLLENFAEDKYKTGALAGCFFDPATAAFVVNDPSRVIAAKDHNIRVDHYKKACVLQILALRAVESGDLERLILLMGLSSDRIEEKINSPHASRTGDKGVVVTWSMLLPESPKNPEDPVESFDTANFDTRMKGAFWPDKKYPDWIEKVVSALRVDMESLLKSIGELVVTNHRSSSSAGAGDLEAPGGDGEAGDRQVTKREDQALWVQSELTYVIEQGLPDASLDLFGLALSKYLEVRRTLADSSDQARKILALCRDGLLSQAGLGPNMFWYTPSKVDQKALGSLSSRWNDSDISSRSPINQLLEDWYLLHESTVSELMHWGDRAWWEKGYCCLDACSWTELGKLGSLKKHTLFREEAVRPQSPKEWRDHLITIAECDFMLRLVKYKKNSGVRMRLLLGDLRYALGKANKANDDTSEANKVAEIEFSGELGVQEAKTFLGELPALLKAYFDKEGVSERDCMSAVEATVAKQVVTSEDLLEQKNALTKPSAEESRCLLVAETERALENQRRDEREADLQRDLAQRDVLTDGLQAQVSQRDAQIREVGEQLVDARRDAAAKDEVIAAAQRKLSASEEKIAMLERQLAEARATSGTDQGSSARSDVGVARLTHGGQVVAQTQFAAGSRGAQPDDPAMMEEVQLCGPDGIPCVAVTGI